MNGSQEQEVRAAAAHLIEAFSSHDLEEYFGSFRPDATFVFYYSPLRLETREAYMREWAGWEKEGFEVLSCKSTDQLVQVLSEDTAIFTHSVSTEVLRGGIRELLSERETIVFVRENATGRWEAVHEHLSSAPTNALASTSPLEESA